MSRILLVEDNEMNRDMLSRRLARRGYEVVVISTTEPRRGVGRALMERCFNEAKALAVGRVWLVTTNNNIAAIASYQSLGMDLRALHRHAVRKAREVKPTIPSHDEAGIPIDHELELKVDRLLGPQRAVVVEGGDPLRRRHEILRAFRRHGVHEIDDRGLGRAVVPRRERILRRRRRGASRCVAWRWRAR